MGSNIKAFASPSVRSALEGQKYRSVWEYCLPYKSELSHIQRKDNLFIISHTIIKPYLQDSLNSSFGGWELQTGTSAGQRASPF